MDTRSDDDTPPVVGAAGLPPESPAQLIEMYPLVEEPDRRIDLLYVLPRWSVHMNERACSHYPNLGVTVKGYRLSDIHSTKECLPDVDPRELEELRQAIHESDYRPVMRRTRTVPMRSDETQFAGRKRKLDEVYEEKAPEGAPKTVLFRDLQRQLITKLVSGHIGEGGLVTVINYHTCDAVPALLPDIVLTCPRCKATAHLRDIYERAGRAACLSCGAWVSSWECTESELKRATGQRGAVGRVAAWLRAARKSPDLTGETLQYKNRRLAELGVGKTDVGHHEAFAVMSAINRTIGETLRVIDSQGRGVGTAEVRKACFVFVDTPESQAYELLHSRLLETTWEGVRAAPPLFVTQMRYDGRNLLESWQVATGIGFTGMVANHYDAEETYLRMQEFLRRVFLVDESGWSRLVRVVNKGTLDTGDSKSLRPEHRSYFTVHVADYTGVTQEIPPLRAVFMRCPIDARGGVCPYARVWPLENGTLKSDECEHTIDRIRRYADERRRQRLQNTEGGRPQAVDESDDKDDDSAQELGELLSKRARISV